MASKIDISSNALILLGDNPISSFSEGSFGATAAANLYDGVYEALLSAHPWSFALKEQYLSQLTQAPENITGYNYAYQLPTDMIRIWETFTHSNYVIVGDLLYSNLNEILMRYIYKPDEQSLPPHFVKALEYKLASEFAVFIGESGNLAGLYEQKYIIQVSQAMAIDSQNRPQDGFIDAPFTDVRTGGGYNNGSGGY